jgi:hypothetical protein
MLCDGNADEYCGAGDRLDVYQLDGSISSSTTSSATSSASATATGPVHVPTAGPYVWIGCYTEATNSRALDSDTLVNYDTMTVEMCEAFCAGGSYTMFGVEYGEWEKKPGSESD